MIKCRYCQKVLDEYSDTKEIEQQFHFGCAKVFFGVEDITELDISCKEIDMLSESKSITGVQRKMSVGFSKKDKRITSFSSHLGYIIKPQTNDYLLLPENEYLIMSLANFFDIKTVPFTLLNVNNENMYITKRIDRLYQKGKQIRLAMEDFAQLSLKPEEDKYNGSYELVYRVLNKYSSFPNLDKIELFKIVLFSFLLGNSDLHLKNFSLFEEVPYSSIYRLTPAYDLISTKIVLNDDEDLALSMNGKKKNFTKKDFYKFASYIGIENKIVDKIIQSYIEKEAETYTRIDESFLNKEMKNKLKDIFKNHIEIFKNPFKRG